MTVTKGHLAGASILTRFVRCSTTRTWCRPAGLVPVLRLAESAGLHELLGQRLSVPAPNAGAKAACVVAGMLAGADSIDDLDVLRHGGMGTVFDGVRAPSTLGTFLRSFTHGHVQQLDAVASRVLAGLAARCRRAARRRRKRRVRRRRRHDPARSTATPSRAPRTGTPGSTGLNAQLAALSTPIGGAGDRRGPGCARATSRRPGAGPSCWPEAVGTARAAGVTGQVLVRADSALLRRATFVAAAVGARAWFSVTARMNPAGHGRDRQHRGQRVDPDQVPERGLGRRSRSAGSPTPRSPRSTSPRSPPAASTGTCTCRLVVRRVQRLQPPAQRRAGRAVRDATGTTRSSPTPPCPPSQADADHRDHAIVEQVIAELKDGPLAHLPSGRYAANAAWLACAAIAFNLARAAGAVAARHATARWATLRTQLINVPARIATSARRLDPAPAHPTGPGPPPGRPCGTPPPDHPGPLSA